MRTLTAIAFLILLSGVAVLHPAWQWGKEAALEQSWEVRMEAENGKERLVRLGFTRSGINRKVRWEHPREFEFEGQMYDVIAIDTLGDSLFVQCWLDLEETRLKQNNGTEQEHPVPLAGQKESKGRTFTFFSPLFLKSTFYFPRWDFHRGKTLFFEYLPYADREAAPPPAPPPDSAPRTLTTP